MKSTSATYKQILASGETRNYVATINMTLADNTSLTLTEEDIWADTFSIDTASSEQNVFSVGTAVIGMCKFDINNFDERFNSYDFFNATAVVWIGLVGDIDEYDEQIYYRMGFYTVDEPSYNGALIHIEMLDNMWKFDRPLPTISYPTTVLSAIQDLCTECGVTLATQSFDGDDIEIPAAPDQEMNCREYLQYMAMLCGYFCVMNDSGALVIKWYDTETYWEIYNINNYDNLDGGTFDTNTTPYSDGDEADGGNFTDYTSGDNYDGGSFTDYDGYLAWFTRNFDTSIETDILHYTGVAVTIDDTRYLRGSEGYVLEVENPFITLDNKTTILNNIYYAVIGVYFRIFHIKTLSDLSCECGDCCAIRDLHDNLVYSFISNLTFTFTSTTASFGAVSPTRSLSTRYSKTVQQAVSVAKEKTEHIISDYDLAVQMMNNLAVNAMGGYEDYEDLSTGGRIYYLSNRPITKVDNVCSFQSGSTVFKMSGTGFYVSTDGGTTWTNGYDSGTGALVVNVLNAIGVSASWIKTGTLVVGGVGNGNPSIDVRDSNNNTICTITRQGITMNRGKIRSADYSWTSGHYSRVGMEIDLINSYICGTAFYLDNNGGYIGAAQFDDDSMQIIGDIDVGTGTSFTFKPADYEIVADFPLILEGTVSGTTSVTITLTNNGSTTTFGTYSINGTSGVETGNLDHTIGGSNYYTITANKSIKVSAHDVYSAYMGTDGFRGYLQGKFKGYSDSESGEIAGIPYEWYGKFYGSPKFINKSGYGGNESKIEIAYGDNASRPNITREYIDGGVTKTESVAWGSKQSYIDLDMLTPSGSGTEGDMVFVGTQGTPSRQLWRYENGAWVKVAFFSYGTTDLTAGVSSLPTGDVYFVYE